MIEISMIKYMPQILLKEKKLYATKYIYDNNYRSEVA